MYDKKKEIVKQVGEFKYLVSMISESCELDVRHRVGAGWCKLHEIAGSIVCDKMIPIVFTVAVYKTVIRHVLI